LGNKVATEVRRLTSLFTRSSMLVVLILTRWLGGKAFPVTIGPDTTYNGGPWDAFVTKIVPFQGPFIDIKGNGSDGPLTISYLSNLKVDITLNPGDWSGVDADWWLVGYGYGGFGWYHFKIYPQSWIPGYGITSQGPLYPLGPKDVISSSGLPRGTYIFYFGVDTNRNAVWEPAQGIYDSVTVTIQ